MSGHAVAATAGHPGACEKATINSVCHCECAGVRHGVASVHAFQRGHEGRKLTVTEQRQADALRQQHSADKPKPATEPAPTPRSQPAPTSQPASEPAPTPEPRQRTYADRVATAREGAAARSAAPRSALNPDRPPPMSSAQVDALDAYVSTSYGAINDQLRGTGYGTNPQVTAWIGNVDEVMAASPLADDVAAWRGMGHGDQLFGDRLNGDLTGMEWREDAYVSTSTDRQVSHDFATGDATSTEAPHPVLMRMVVPSGTGAVELSDESYESELMLQRGLGMRVVADHGVSPDGVRMLDVEVIPVAA